MVTRQYSSLSTKNRVSYKRLRSTQPIPSVSQTKCWKSIDRNFRTPMTMLSVFRAISSIPSDEYLKVASSAISVSGAKAFRRVKPCFSVISSIVEREKRVGGKAMELSRFQFIKCWLTRWLLTGFWFITL